MSADAGDNAKGTLKVCSHEAICSKQQGFIKCPDFTRSNRCYFAIYENAHEVERFFLSPDFTRSNRCYFAIYENADEVERFFLSPDFTRSNRCYFAICENAHEVERFAAFRKLMASSTNGCL